MGSAISGSLRFSQSSEEESLLVAYPAMENFIARLPEIVIQLVALALAISVHESAHGWMAERLGDPTARWLGRITLNPIKHIDPVGTVLFPLMLAFMGAPVLGWAKPVPYVPRNLRNPRRDPALVALSGPVSNIIMATATIVILLVIKAVSPGFKQTLATVLQHGAAAAPGVFAPLVYLLFALAMINIVLAVFNLLPLPPLDGSKVLAAILPPQMAGVYLAIDRFGMLILFVLLWTGFLGILLRPFIHGLIWILFI